MLVAILLVWLMISNSAAGSQCGTTFQQIPSPESATANDSLSHLAALSDGTAWAIGSQAGAPAVPLLLYFDGDAWSAQPLPAEVAGMYFGTSCSTPEGDVWLAGSRAFSVYEVEVIYLRARGGVIDRIDHVFHLRAPIAMSATSASDVWALTGAGDVMHFDGFDWTVTDVPASFSTLMYAKGIYAAGPTDVWAVGYGGNMRGQYIGYAQHWDGSSWTTVSTPFDGQQVTFFRGVDGSAPDDVWIVGYINYSQTIALHWDGSAWTQSPSPPSDAPLQEVSVLAPDDAWATPYSLNDTNVLFHWDGNAWNETDPLAAPGGAAVRWAGLAKAGSCDLWATSSYSSGTGNHALIGKRSPVAPEAEPMLISVPVLTNGLFHFEISGSAGNTVAVECSTNMVDWISVTNLTILDGSISFTSTESSDAHQFYRLREEE